MEPENATVEDIVDALNKAPRKEARIVFRVWNDIEENYEECVRALSGIEVDLISEDANVIIYIGGTR